MQAVCIYTSQLCTIIHKNSKKRMKSLLTLFSILFSLYCMQRHTRTYTSFSVVETGSKNKTLPVQPQKTIDFTYQHARVFGNEIAFVGHDLWETTFLWVRLPRITQKGDSWQVAELPYPVKIVQHDKVYWLKQGQIFISKHSSLENGDNTLEGKIAGYAIEGGDTRDTLRINSQLLVTYQNPSIP
jgi:hypothetical protein